MTFQAAQEIWYSFKCLVEEISVDVVFLIFFDDDLSV